MNNLSEVMGLPVEKYVQLTVDRARRDNPDKDDREVARQEKQNFDGLALKFAKGELDDEPQHLYNSLQKAGDRMGNALENLVSGEPQEREAAFSFGVPSENERVSWRVPQGIGNDKGDIDPGFVRNGSGNPHYNGDPGFSIGSISGYDFDRGFSMMPPAVNGNYNQRGFGYPKIQNGMGRGLQGPVNFNFQPSREDNPFSPRLEQIIEEAVRSKMRYSGNNQNVGSVKGPQNVPFPFKGGNEPGDFKYLSDTMKGNMGTNEPNVTLVANVNKNNQPSTGGKAQFDPVPPGLEPDHRWLEGLMKKYPITDDADYDRPDRNRVHSISPYEHPAIPGSGEYNLFASSLGEVDKVGIRNRKEKDAFPKICMLSIKTEELLLTRLLRKAVMILLWIQMALFI